MIRVDNRIEFLLEVKNLLPINPICLEIGVWRGEFSKKIIDVLSPKELHLVDPWETGYDKNGKEEFYPGWSQRTAYSNDNDFEVVTNLLEQEIKEKKVITYKNFSYDVVNKFNNNYFDFIYIDACHLYDCVMWDMENYLIKLKHNGVLSGHDYKDGLPFGVIEAVDDFCKKYNYKILVHNTYDGDWVVMPN